jgi:FKBP-type peptidyl-prolyl cis-trans isomerase 2
VEEAMILARPVPCLVAPLLLALALAAGAEEASGPAAATAEPAAPAGAGSPAEPVPGRRGEVVQSGDWVWIDFAVWQEDGSLLETTTHSQPVRIQQGTGRVPQAVDQALLGMAIDEHKSLRVPVDEPEGDAAANRYESVELAKIPETTRQVGHPIVMDDGAGNRRAGRVHEIEGDRAVIDWLPMAGQTLTFDFRVVDIYVAGKGE